MRSYDPARPLVYIHVPKAAGSSMNRVLRRWFGRRLYRQYFDERRNRMPRRHRLRSRWSPGRFKRDVCIVGHFNTARGFGIQDYYPEVEQFATILRDPFEIALSNYFFARGVRPL